jgi:hypothetical protein
MNDQLPTDLGACSRKTQGGGVGGDEEEGAVVVGVFPGVFDGGAGLADAAVAVDGALTFDDDGAFCGKLLAEFGEELIAAFEQEAMQSMNCEG